MLKKIIHAVIIGLMTAAVILFMLPKINQDNSDLSLEGKVISFNNAVRIASPSVVNVYNKSFISTDDTHIDSKVTNLGSGVIMRKDGYILTNRHVIQDADQIIVTLQTGQVSEANLIGSDSLTDLAVLKIKANNLPTIPQNPERPIHIGDVAIAIGNPYNLGQSVSQGIISATGRSAVGDAAGWRNFIQTDASINRGNSGGALINSLGELVGINTLSYGKDTIEMAEGLNFAIPISIANDVLTKIIRDGRVIRGYIGIESNIISYTYDEKGILVTGVAPNGPAEKAGIIAGDLIVQLDNKQVTSPAEMMKMIADTAPNTQVEVTIARLGKKIKLPVTLAEHPKK